jgi:hypothetical protein
MNKKLAYILETKRLIPFGIYSQILGVVLLSVGLFVQIPWVMILTMPTGMGLIGLGMLCWAYFFFDNL